MTNRPPVSAEEEIERVVPLIEAVVGELGARVSVDTYKPAVARAAIAAGACDRQRRERPARPRAGRRVRGDRRRAGGHAHDRAAEERLPRPGLDGRIVGDVERFLAERIELAMSRGVAFEQMMVDPGPDFSKTPAQTVAVLRALPALHALGRPILLAVSRKDFVGALTRRPPRARLAGTLAAMAHGVDRRAPTSCASTTWPTPRISWPCAAALGGDGDVESAAARLGHRCAGTSRCPTPAAR